MRRVLILGAAGRDFHDFNTAFRQDPAVEVVAFTATQIPDIAGRTYPAALAGPRYPRGIPIHPQEELERLVRELAVDEVVLSYSDLPHEQVMHLASRALAAGAGFRLLSPHLTQLPVPCPVLSVGAVRTGAGKSPVARYLAGVLRQLGHRVGVLRHPMPYGDLAAQAVQRFASPADLERHACTIEEREEYEPHLEAGGVVWAGVDYAEIARRAAAESDLLLWEGGNNDLPFLRSDLHVVVADPLRPGHESRYHPGEANVRAADVLVLHKVDAAGAERTLAVREALRALNPRAPIVETASPVSLDDPGALRGRRAVVVEDGPTVTHGECPSGAGLLAARRAGAEVLDPRPFARGSLVEVFARYPHLGPVLPAMGYGAAQLADLSATLRALPEDVVVVAGTPIDLARLLRLERPCQRARYGLVELGSPGLAALVRERFPAPGSVTGRAQRGG